MGVCEFLNHSVCLQCLNCFFNDVSHINCSGYLATDIRDLLWRLYGAERDKYLYNILFRVCYLGIRLRSLNAELFLVSWSLFCPRYTYP